MKHCPCILGYAFMFEDEFYIVEYPYFSSIGMDGSFKMLETLLTAYGFGKIIRKGNNVL